MNFVSKKLSLLIVGALLTQSVSMHAWKTNLAIFGIPTAAGAILVPVIGLAKDKVAGKSFSGKKFAIRFIVGVGIGASVGGLSAGINHWHSKKKNKNKKPFSITPQTPQERAQKAARLKQESTKRQQEVRKRLEKQKKEKAQQQQAADQAKKDKEAQEMEKIMDELETAIYTNDPEIVEKLKKQNFDFNKIVSYLSFEHANMPTNGTFLMQAIDRGATKIAAQLIDDPSLAIDLNTVVEGQTPLLRAVIKGNKEIVQKLLEKDADHQIKSAGGSTPLDIAISNGDQPLIDLLINHGAPQTLDNKLSLALQAKNLDLFDQMLTEEKARLLKKHDNNHLMAETLFANVADDHLPAINQMNNPADQRKFLDIVLKHGGDINAHGKNEDYPFFAFIVDRRILFRDPTGDCADQHQRFDSCFKLFLEKGVNCNTKLTKCGGLRMIKFDEQNESPTILQLTVAAKAFDLAEAMMAHGGNGDDLKTPNLQAILARIDKAHYPLLAAACINP